MLPAQLRGHVLVARVTAHLPANPHVDDVSRNKLLTGLRSVAERGNALLKKTWPALQTITLDPHRLTEITAAALVLLHLQRGTRRSRW